VDDDQPTRNQPPADGERPAAETERFPRPASDETSVLPAAQEPAQPPARWSARAGVPIRDQAPEPGWVTGEEPPRTWWAPVLIVVAIVVLLGLIGLGLFLAVRPQPAPVASASDSPSATASSASPTPSPSATASASPSVSMVAVPDLNGDTVPEAQEFLQGRGLNWRVVTQVSDQPAGTVIGTDPPADTLVPAGTEVTLFVATPTSSSAVPGPSNP